MELHDAVARHPMQEIVGGEAMIEGADIDIVHVEQEPAIGAPRHLADKLPLRHLRATEGDVARHVLQGETAAEEVLDMTDTVNDVIQRLRGVRHGQEVVQVHAVNAGPAQMIGNPFRVHALRKVFQPAQIVHVEGRRGSDREGHAVHHDGIPLADLVEDAQRLAARDHIVLGYDLEPIDGRRSIQDLRIMLGSEA